MPRRCRCLLRYKARRSAAVAKVAQQTPGVAIIMFFQSNTVIGRGRDGGVGVLIVFFFHVSLFGKGSDTIATPSA